MSTKIGCCGSSKGREKYFREFKLVELQRVFYNLPSVGVVRKWREEAPEDFEFSLKAWQVMTHSPSSLTCRRAGSQIPGMMTL